MKKIMLLFVFLMAGMGLNAQTDAIDAFFQEYVDDPRFTVVYISPRLMGLFQNMDVDEWDMDDDDAATFLKITKGLKGLRILTTDGGDADGLYEEAVKKIDTSGYEVLMKVRDNDGSNLNFYIKENEDNTISELFLIAGGAGEEFVLLSFVGNMSLDEVTKMAKEIEDKNRH